MILCRCFRQARGRLGPLRTRLGAAVKSGLIESLIEDESTCTGARRADNGRRQHVARQESTLTTSSRTSASSRRRCSTDVTLAQRQHSGGMLTSAAVTVSVNEVKSAGLDHKTTQISLKQLPTDTADRRSVSAVTVSLHY